MLIEETVLFLLRAGGYHPVDDDDTDPTLSRGPEGLGVVGRGEVHAPGALADFSPTPPFTLPQRLLLEARTYADTTPVDLPIVRQAAGILKDVNENWRRGAESGLPRQRYLYQYALLSTTGYSVEAQRFAFVQDIHLIQLGSIPPLAPLLEAIQRINHNLFKAASWNAIRLALPELRQVMQKILFRSHDERLLRVLVPNIAVRPLMRVAEVTWALEGLLLGMIGGRFPIPLAPQDQTSPEMLENLEWAIERDRAGWRLRDIDGEAPPIWFNFPARLFALYAEQGVFGDNAEIQLFFSRTEQARLLKLRLEPDWLQNTLATIL